MRNGLEEKARDLYSRQPVTGIQAIKIAQEFYFGVDTWSTDTTVASCNTTIEEE